MASRNVDVFRITGPLWEESTGDWPVDSPHKGPVMRDFDVFFVVSVDKLLKEIRVAGDLRQHDAHVMSQ